MLGPLESAPVEAAQLLGDPHPLVERLGSAGGLATLSLGATLSAPEVTDRCSLGRFLGWYHSELLVPVELPAIRRAYEHASRNELRELIEFDRQLDREAGLRSFAEASRAVGRSQLRRLLPLRDQRLVRRYWEAVEVGRARAWHILVYGLVLSIYSLPLRQGLLHYAQQTLGGFIQSAAGRLALSAGEAAEVCAGAWRELPPAIESALPPDAHELRAVR